ncbi:MAG: NADH-quinone oxidoreductase subunit L [SAR202 cluster bacterium]|nr:NADH-quinone oxidoreductase subunit L [SAR202 cluster bacterium]
MVSEPLVWAILLLPVLSFLIISLVIRPFLNRIPALSGWLLIGCLLAALALSLMTLWAAAGHHVPEFRQHAWLSVGSATIAFGLLVDPLTAVMLVVVTAVSLLVQVYSQGYMKGDPSYSRYYAYMSLFTAAMLGLLLASNIVQLYMFWELVGLASYLLIGFWHHRPAAAAAAKKAFIMTRIGDVGFLIAILYLFFQSDKFAAAGLNAFHIPDIWQAAQPLAAGGAILGGAALTWVVLGIFAGAAGKSAQFPLHAWLPDAMEGPTPVSALIHAATMVAAGVFLVARFYPLFLASSAALTVVALIGAFTAFLAATMGLVMNDIKRVLAYSTVSQLGYMMAALGMGAYSAALFHLFTHAFFKALLFLAAGSVNHAVDTFNMTYMGGLRRHMPWTYVLTIIGGLSLVGIIPLAGFWSKDEILSGVWGSSELVAPWVGRLTFLLLAVSVLLTAFYTLRLVILTFHGQFRGGGEKEREEAGVVAPAPVSAHAADSHHSAAQPAGHGGGHHLAESPMVMLLPMLVLGVGTVAAGYVANPQWVHSLLGIPGHWITEFFHLGLEEALSGREAHLAVPEFSLGMAAASTLIALAGLALAAALYRGRGAETRKDPLERGGPVYVLLNRRYLVDVLYENVLTGRVFYRAVAGALDWLDRNLVDGLVNLTGLVFRNAGRPLGLLQTGQVQFYAVALTLGSLLVLLGYLVLR